MGKLNTRAIVLKDGKLLVVRLKDMPQFWSLPGGGLEDGESLNECLEREIMEELGVKPVIGNLLYIHQIKYPNGFTVPELLFHVTNTDDFSKIYLSTTTHGDDELVEVAFKDPSKIRLLPGFLQTELANLSKEKLADTTTEIKYLEPED